MILHNLEVEGAKPWKRSMLCNKEGCLAKAPVPVIQIVPVSPIGLEFDQTDKSSRRHAAIVVFIVPVPAIKHHKAAKKMNKKVTSSDQIVEDSRGWKRGRGGKDEGGRDEFESRHAEPE